MTRPIQEPTTQRAVRGLGFSADQLFRRPAPRSSHTLPYCYMRWTGSASVPANTLYNVISDDDYEESFIYDPDEIAEFSCDRGSGCIQWNLPGEYLIHAVGEWNGTGSAGETLGTIIDMGEECIFATARVVNAITADATNQNMDIPVTSMMFDFASDRDSVRTLVYHTDAGGNDIGRVWIHVVQLNSFVDGIFDP